MTADPNHLTAAEKRSAIRGPLYRVLGTPVVALLGLANTAIVVRETGAAVFGLVALVATITLLFPFADLGIGATSMTAGAQLGGPNRDPRAADVIRRSYHVLFGVAGALIVLALAIMAADRWTVLTGFPCRRIVVMPRTPEKGAADDAETALRVLEDRGVLDGWETTVIAGVTENGAAAPMCSSKIFLAVSVREGFWFASLGGDGV